MPSGIPVALAGRAVLFDVTDMMSSASAMPLPYRDRATPGHGQRRGFDISNRLGTHRMNRGSAITDP
jgi:hypothetical protein